MSTEQFDITFLDSDDAKVTKNPFEIIPNSTTAKEGTKYTTVLAASTDETPAITSSISTFTSKNEFSKSAPFQFETFATKRPCNRTSESHRTIRSSCHDTEHDEEFEKSQEISTLTISTLTTTPGTTTLPFQYGTSKLSKMTTITTTTKTVYVTPLSTEYFFKGSAFGSSRPEPDWAQPDFINSDFITSITELSSLSSTLNQSTKKISPEAFRIMIPAISLGIFLFGTVVSMFFETISKIL